MKGPAECVGVEASLDEAFCRCRDRGVVAAGELVNVIVPKWCSEF